MSVNGAEPHIGPCIPPGRCTNPVCDAWAGPRALPTLRLLNTADTPLFRMLTKRVGSALRHHRAKRIIRSVPRPNRTVHGETAPIRKGKREGVELGDL
jgi:hypothetical protein